MRGADLRGRVRMRADVCVVGTGAGGGVVAKELAEGGLSVVMLEEGELLRPSDFTARPRDLSPRFYRDGAQVMTLGQRADRAAARQGGRRDDDPQLRHVLPHAARAARALGPVDGGRARPVLPPRRAHLQRLPRPARDRRAQRAAHGARRRAARLVGRVPAPRRARLRRLGRLRVRLPERRQAAHRQHVRPARVGRRRGDRDRRARRQGPARPRRPRPHRAAARGCASTPTSSSSRAGRSARRCCCERSGIRHPALGRNLSLHPASGVWAEVDEDVDMSAGVPQAYAVDEFAAEGIMLEGWTGPPDMLALSLPGTGAEHRRLVTGWRRLAQTGLMIRDDSRGTVHAVGGKAVIRYDVERGDTAPPRARDRPRGRARARRRRPRRAPADPRRAADHRRPAGPRAHRDRQAARPHRLPPARHRRRGNGRRPRPAPDRRPASSPTARSSRARSASTRS